MHEQYGHRQMEHTADIRLHVWADQKELLFPAALDGMNEILIETTEKKNAVEFIQNLEINARDFTCLLIDFLSEVLFLSYQNQCIFQKVKILELTDHHLKCCISGRMAGYFADKIKAITYHEADVIYRDGRWSTLLVFDI